MNEVEPYAPFSEYIISAGVHPDGIRYGYYALLRFENNYGADIIQGGIAYTRDTSEHELAVIHFDEGGEYSLVCDGDGAILGHLSIEEVYLTLEEIKALPPRVNLLEGAQT